MCPPELVVPRMATAITRVPSRRLRSPGAATLVEEPHGTTILAIRYADGVIVAGDRLASAGYEVFHRRVAKVRSVDEFSAVALSGIGGGYIEDVATLLELELEHYEKVEGEALSVDGKANVLARMVRMNLTTTSAGLRVIPIFAGFDSRRGEARIFSYDVTGGCYEEFEYAAKGSGGRDARATLKKLYRHQATRSEAVHAVAEALVDAAEEDLATGPCDFVRDVFPTIGDITRHGYAEVSAMECRRQFAAVLSSRAADAGAC